MNAPLLARYGDRTAKAVGSEGFDFKHGVAQAGCDVHIPNVVNARGGTVELNDGIQTAFI